MNAEAIIRSIEAEHLKSNLPKIYVGDSVEVGVRITEGNKERVQPYKGTVIAKRNGGINETITVRRIFQGVGVERVFLLHSPIVAHIKVERRGGTYVCMEGPAFSTKAESNLYRSWGATVIGMTNLTEAKLAREAEIAYATLALVTDYDCWHSDHDNVTVEMVIANLQRNAVNAQKVIQQAVKRVAENPPESVAHSALKYAILTPPDKISSTIREKLALLLNKYLVN